MIISSEAEGAFIYEPHNSDHGNNQNQNKNFDPKCIFHPCLPPSDKHGCNRIEEVTDNDDAHSADCNENTRQLGLYSLTEHNHGG